MAYTKRVKKWMQGRRNKFAKRYPRLNNLSDVAGKMFGFQKQLNIVKSMINSEVKFADNGAGPVEISSTGSLTLLNPIAQGTDVNNRTGNSILAKYLVFKLTAVCDADQAAAFVRMMIVVDKDNQGVAPTLAEILQVTTQSDAIVSNKNVDETDRFWVLKDRVITLNTSGRRTQYVKCYIPLKFHIKFSGTGATEADVDQNSIYLVLVSDIATANNYPFITWYSRLGYYDN